MDYQVFLVSRIHEEWQRTGDNARAITLGQAETVVIIMIAMFGGFVLGDDRAIKLFGIGLGSAVLLDAFAVRTVLIPSLMHLLGKANWYLPSWLDRALTRVCIDANDAEQPEPEKALVSV